MVTQQNRKFLTGFFFIAISLQALVFSSVSLAQIIAQPAPTAPVLTQPPTKALVAYTYGLASGAYDIKYTIGNVPGGGFTSYILEQNILEVRSISDNLYVDGNFAYMDYITLSPSGPGPGGVIKQAKINLANPANPVVRTLAVPLPNMVLGFNTALGRNMQNSPTTFGIVAQMDFANNNYTLNLFQYDLVTLNLQIMPLNHPSNLALSGGLYLVPKITSTSNIVEVYYTRKETINDTHTAVYRVDVDIRNGGTQSQPVRLTPPNSFWFPTFHEPRSVQVGPKSVKYGNILGYDLVSLLLPNNTWSSFLSLPYRGWSDTLMDDTTVLLSRRNSSPSNNELHFYILDQAFNLRYFQLVIPGVYHAVIHKKLIRDSSLQVKNQFLVATLRWSGGNFVYELQDIDSVAGSIRQTYPLDTKPINGIADMRIMHLP